jgi:hypothetical protein
LCGGLKRTVVRSLKEDRFKWIRLKFPARGDEVEGSSVFWE